MRTRKKSDRARRTHFLETAERETCQDTENNQLHEGHTQPGDGRGRELSEHGKPTNREALTSWRQQSKGLVRTQKETDRTRGTHSLEIAEGVTCQDMERNGLSGEHSLPEDGRGRDLSGHGKKPTE